MTTSNVSGRALGARPRKRAFAHLSSMSDTGWFQYRFIAFTVPKEPSAQYSSYTIRSAVESHNLQL